MNQQGPNLPPRKTFSFIWLAMFLAPIIYVVIGHFLMGELGKEAPDLNAIRESPHFVLGILLIVVTTVQLIIGLMWPRFTLTEEKLRKKGSKSDVLQHVSANAIVSLAFLESIPVYALVWSFITYHIQPLDVAAPLAMIAMLYMRMQIITHFNRVDELFPME